MLLLELDRSAIDMVALSEAQGTSDALPHAMAGFIEWLAPQMDALPELLRRAFEETRYRATTGGEHLRVPGIVANLWLGLDCGLRYAQELGAISETEASEMRSRCGSALEDTGLRQAISVEGERPTRRFLSILATLLAQGRAVLLTRDSRPDSYNGPNSFVGWQDNDSIYLVSDASYQAVARFCRDSGESFPVRSERLLRDFNREGVSECAAGRNTTTTRLGGQKRRVLKLRRDRAEELLGEALPGSSDFGTEGTAGTASEE
jgi:DNA polymerase-1